MMKFDFTGKVIFVTGGSRGIGKTCANSFAEAGASVIITYKSARADAEETLNALTEVGSHAAFQLDASNPQMIEAVFQKAVGQFGRIDVLVNNAGIYIEHKIFDVGYNEWKEAWQQTIDTNLIGAGNLCYFAARQMKEYGGGKIINISSRGHFAESLIIRPMPLPKEDLMP